MDIDLFIKGFMVGFSIAAPVGPIGVLCIKKTLIEGRIHGFVTGLGAASADAFYGYVAAFGVSFITAALVDNQQNLALFGGLFLLYLGAKTYISKPTSEAAETNSTGLIGNYLSTFILTLTNPLTILFFSAMFAGFGIDSSSTVSSLLFVSGVFSGSALWWLILVYGASILKTRFDTRVVGFLNKGSGLAIIGFGFISLLRLL
jgi:threonine/homoserine/homoserine lactone efflux protein